MAEKKIKISDLLNLMSDKIEELNKKNYELMIENQHLKKKISDLEADMLVDEEFLTAYKKKRNLF